MEEAISSQSTNSSSISSNNQINNEISKEVIYSIVTVFNSIIESHKYVNINCKNTINFCLKTIPSISLFDYLSRINKYTNLDISTLISALIYIDRFCCNANIILNEYNIHTILFISIYVSIKFHEDISCKDDYFAKIGGLSLEEISKLSLIFICVLDYKLYINYEDYKRYENYFWVRC